MHQEPPCWEWLQDREERDPSGGASDVRENDTACLFANTGMSVSKHESETNSEKVRTFLDSLRHMEKRGMKEMDLSPRGGSRQTNKTHTYVPLVHGGT